MFGFLIPSTDKREKDFAHQKMRKQESVTSTVVVYQFNIQSTNRSTKGTITDVGIFFEKRDYANTYKYDMYFMDFMHTAGEKVKFSNDNGSVYIDLAGQRGIGMEGNEKAMYELYVNLLNAFEQWRLKYQDVLNAREIF